MTTVALPTKRGAVFACELLGRAVGLGEAAGGELAAGLAVGEPAAVGEPDAADEVLDWSVHPASTKTATASTETSQFWIFVCILSYPFQRIHFIILRRERTFGPKNRVTILLMARPKI